MSKCLMAVSAGLFLACVCVSGCTQNGQVSSDPPVSTADTVRTAGFDQQNSEPSGEGYRVKFETTKGDFVIRVVRDWAPNGADRFEELVEAGYYDGCRFFRVLDNFMAQVGVNGDPAVSARWRIKNIPDDRVLESNRRGYVTFATSGPNSRTTQFFINFKHNQGLDADGFSPFGKVIEGMDVVDSLYSGYGEGAPNGNGPDQGRVQNEGNEYLNQEFPKLDYIKRATIIGRDE